MNKEQIVKEVLKRMDEISPLDAINVLPNPVVEGLLDECANNILLSAPIHLCPATFFEDMQNDIVSTDEVNVAQILLPTGYLRLIRFKLNNWTRPTNKVVEEGSPAHRLQYFKYTCGLRSRPVVTIVRSINGTCLEYYYAKGTQPTISTASCIVSTPTEQMPEKLLPALYWDIAATAFHVFGMGDQSKAAMSKVEEQYKLLSNGN